MKNAHLRSGSLTYVKSTEKTTTSIKLRLDRFIGVALPDPPRQAKAHFISVIGGDTQIAVVSAAISLGDPFLVEGPECRPHSRMPRTQCTVLQRVDSTRRPEEAHTSFGGIVGRVRQCYHDRLWQNVAGRLRQSVRMGFDRGSLRDSRNPGVG